jgi:hypothetical protein
MSRPDFTAATIGDLRERVIAHNSRDGATPVKLGALKAVYIKGWSGRDPAKSALAKVDAHLGALAKAEDFNDADHPRANDGKFSGGNGGGKPPSASIPLPATPAEHKQLTGDNAGYAALQSSIIPETRFGTAGSVLRDGGALLAGLGYAASLARGKPNGLAARGLRGAGGAAGRLGAGIASGIVNRAYAAGKGAILRATGKDTPLKQAMRTAAARTRTRAAAEAGRTAGQKLGTASFKLQSKLVQGFARAAEDGGTTPRRAAIRRKTAIAMAGLVPAYALRSAIQGTPADPQVIGGGIDSLSYRQVQKMVMSDELGAAQTAMLELLNKGVDFGDLRKAMPRIPMGAGHPYSGVGRLVLGGAAALAGAFSGGAAGAGVGHLAGGKKGNPNHDSHGRFSSSTNAKTGWGAAIGAVLGAAGAGVAVYAGLKSHNIGILRATGLASKLRTDKLLGAIDSVAGAGAVKGLIRRRAVHIESTVDRAIASHPKVVAAEAANALLGASQPLHYKLRVEGAVNDHIANMAGGQNKFKVRDAGGVWTTIGDIKAGTRMEHVKTANAVMRAKAFVARASDKDFDTAIAGLSPEQQATHKQWFKDRQALVDGVDQQLAGHHGRITAADAKVEAAAVHLDKVTTAAMDAKAVTDRGGTLDELRTASDAQAAADLVVSKATTAHISASKAAERIRAANGEVRMPVGLARGGQVIDPPSESERKNALAQVWATARKELTEKAGKAYDARIAAARTGQRQFLAERSNRNLAGLALLGAKIGSPKSARAAQAAAIAAHDEFHAVNGALSAAKQQHATLAKALADLGGLKKPPAAGDETAVRAALSVAKEQLANAKARLDGAPKAGAAAAKAAYAGAAKAHVGASKAALHFDVAAAAEKVKTLTGEVALARARRGSAAMDFDAALATPAPRSRFKLLPDGLVHDLKADLQQARSSMSGTARALFDKPTMRSLKAFAEDKYAKGKSAGIGGYNQLFRTLQPDGSYHLQWAKVATRGPVALGVAAATATGAKEFFDYGRTKAFGTDEQKAKARRPAMPFQFQNQINGSTGAHYFAITAAHPTEKGERVILYGERGENLEDRGRQMVPGGKLSDVTGQFQNGRWNRPSGDSQGHSQGAGQGQPQGKGAPHTGPLDGFTDADALTKVKVAIQSHFDARDFDTSDIAGNTKIRGVRDGTSTGNAERPVINHMRQAYLNQGKGGNDKASLFGGLKALYSHPAQLLTPTQRYEMLTNRGKTGGNAGYDHGLFSNGNAFNTVDNAQAGKALALEIDRAVKMSPSHDEAANLHRAVYTVGQVRGLSQETLKPIHALIERADTGPSSSHQQGQRQQQNQGRQQQNQGPGPSSSASRHEPPKATPKEWDKDELDTLATAAATTIRKHGGASFAWEGNEDDLATATKMFAINAGTLHDLTMRESVDAARNAIMHHTTSNGASNNAANIKEGHYESDAGLFEELDAQAKKIKARREANKLDSLDELMKAFGAFDSAKHPHNPSGPGGGEFSAGDGATPASTAPSALSALGQPKPQRQPGVSELHPAAAVPALANLAGMQGAWMMADHYLPKGAKVGAAVGAKLASAFPAQHAERAAKLFPALKLKAADLGLRAAKASAKYPEGNAIRTAATAAAGVAGSKAEAAGVHAAAKAAAAGVLGQAEKGGAGAVAQAAFNIAERFLPPSVHGAVEAATLGAKFVGSGIAGMAAGAAGSAAVDGAYHLAGAKSPKLGADNASAGHMLAGIGGNMAGGAIGEAAGSAIGTWAGRMLGGAAGTAIGPEGTVAGALAGGVAGKSAGAFAGKFIGGIAAGWGGGIAAGRAYDWFKGYPEAHVARATKTFMSPQKVTV